MGLCILLAVVSLLTSADAVLAFGHANQLTPFTAPDAQPWPPVLTSTQSSTALKRSLRTDKKTQDNHDDVDDQEERAVQTNVFDHALDHVGNVVSTGLKESTFLKKLDDKIDLWYWRLMRKTLEKLRKCSLLPRPALAQSDRNTARPTCCNTFRPSCPCLGR
ncbi:hypothetical protein PR003_g26938 [Phytophthora rubi]|uniref:RxLR effector protein n=1 Tax=Phytophthora rubi TaxID=129364 RepID=A0A6A4C5K9_9STRA|nr:hypothetical protein PR003_g26938 [Phytophthora rubi]